MKSKIADIGKVTAADFICKCGYTECYFDDSHCKKCGQEFPPGHGAMYVPFKDWPVMKDEI